MFDATSQSAQQGKRENAASDAKIHPVNPTAIKVACSNCNLRELCMPMGLKAEELEKIDEVVSTRRKIKRGARLYSNGE